MNLSVNELSFNIDVETNIRYGVIQSNLVEFWLQESEPWCELELIDEVNQIFPEKNNIRVFEAIGYEAKQYDENIVVFKSPYYTYGKFVGKHMPGAVHMNVSYATDKDPKCYCFGPEFHDRHRIPYDIYEVATGKLIHKNKWVKL